MDDGVEVAADHPLETAARASIGGVLTEVAVALAAVAVLVSYGGDLDAKGVGLTLAHALGTGLGAAVALAAFEAARGRWGGRSGVAAGLLLAPLAPMGGWYVHEWVGSGDVARATAAVLETLRAVDREDTSWLVGVAVLGYGVVLAARARGWSVLAQAAASAWVLSAFGLLLVLVDADALGALPLRAWSALVAVRAAALPSSLAVGDRVGRRLVRAWRREGVVATPAPATRRRSWPSRTPAALLFVLAGLGLAASWECPGEPVAVMLARLTTRADVQRMRLALWLLDERERRHTSRLQPPRSAVRAPSRRLSVGPLELATFLSRGGVWVDLRASAVACLRGPAGRGNVEAMVTLAIVLDRSDVWNREWSHGPVATPDERREALRWLERAARAGDPIAQRELGTRLVFGGDDREAGLEWLRRAHAGGEEEAGRWIARFLADDAPAEAVAWARALAASGDDPRGQVLSELLGSYPELRSPADDRYLPASPDLHGARPLLAALPWNLLVAPPDGAAPEEEGRRRALKALRERSGAPVPSLALVGWHLRAAAGGPLVVSGHLDVAEVYLAAVRGVVLLDARVLLAGALCDAARAFTELEGEGERLDRARRARERLHVLSRLHPDDPAGRQARALVEPLLAFHAGPDGRSSPKLLRALAARHEREAHESSVDFARGWMHQRAAERLRALADE